MVQRKDERRIKAALKVGGSPFSPISPGGPEQQLADGDERKSRRVPFNVAEIW
jgi:hypothetical protein